MEGMDSQAMPKRESFGYQPGIDPAIFQKALVMADTPQPEKGDDDGQYLCPLTLDLSSMDCSRETQGEKTYNDVGDSMLPGQKNDCISLIGEGESDPCFINPFASNDQTAMEPLMGGPIYNDGELPGDAFSESTPQGLDGVGANMAESQQHGPKGTMPTLTKASSPDMLSTSAELVKYLREFPKSLLQAALDVDEPKKAPADAPRESESGPGKPRRCPDPECGKLFNRRCELRCVSQYPPLSTRSHL